VQLDDPDGAWYVWRLMEATGWRFLPYSGALLDQPESLIDDLMTISQASMRVRETLSGRSTLRINPGARIEVQHGIGS